MLTLLIPFALCTAHGASRDLSDHTVRSDTRDASQDAPRAQARDLSDSAPKVRNGGVRTPRLDPEAQPEQLLYHGFRVGYTYVAGIEETSILDSPHLFVLGYEATYRALGGEWLDVVVIGNGSIAGMNQSTFIPSANGLVGFAIKKQIELGTGINWSPFDPSGNTVHQVVAVGWTPPAGKFNLPIHVTWIPDVDGNWRLGSTIGVNW